MTQRSRHHKHRKTVSPYLLALLALYLLVAGFFLYMGYRYQFIRLSGLSLAIPLAILLVLGLASLLIYKRRLKRLTGLFLMLSTILLCIGLYAQKTVVDVSNRLNRSASVSETVMSIVVPADSDLTDVTQLSRVLTATDSDASNTEIILAQLKSEKGVDPATESVASYQEAYEKLMAKEVPAMVLNSAYGDLLETIHPDYSEGLRTLYTYTVKKSISLEENSQKAITNADSFNIYISGIDTYGPITTVARSDVNIIMTVNRVTNQILLTTTPRDSYVPIAGGGNDQYDKLTHSGIYGIDASVQTLENLYDIDISYYARINFTSFLNLIDALGGIEVYNDQEFVSHIGSYHYPVGNISLDSERALGFVRERYGLSDGDRDRGRNQNKVIAAIITKLTSINALTNYTSIIESVGDSVQTDMPLATMMTLANDQITSGKKYTIVSQSLEGTGSTGELPSYAMPNASLYMMSIDETSLSSVKSAIHRTLEGN